MPIKKLFCINLILFCGLVSLFSQSDEERRIEWDHVDGASRYLVEIDQDGVVIHSVETSDNYLPLFLKPGEYRLRVSVYNKFNKLASRGEWSTLSVFPSLQPVILEVSPEVFYNDEENYLLKIRGNDFEEGCSFALFSPGGEVKGEVLDFSRKNDDVECTVLFPGGDFSSYKFWSLRINNPSGRYHERNSVIVMEDRLIPVIASMNPHKMTQGVNPGRILLEGENFSSQLILDFTGPSPVEASDITVFFGREISFNLDTENLIPGNYQVSVINNKTVESEPFSFTVKEPKINKAEKAKEVSEEIQSYGGFSYFFSFPTGDVKKLYDENYIGLELIYRLRFRNPSIFKIPILRNTGIALSVDSTYFEVEFNRDYKYVPVAGYAGLYYLSDWSIPLNLYFSMAIGMGYNFFFFPDQDMIRSLDMVTKFEGGIQIRTDSNLRLEAGASSHMVHFLYSEMNSFCPYIRMGWVF